MEKIPELSSTECMIELLDECKRLYIDAGCDDFEVKWYIIKQARVFIEVFGGYIRNQRIGYGETSDDYYDFVIDEYKKFFSRYERKDDEDI